MQHYINVLKQYTIFTGRASRAEYWYFFLFNFLISIGLSILDAMVLQVGWLSLLYSLAVFLPGLAVSVRRLHDTNRSGWWLFISLVPLVGGIVLLIFLIQEGDKDKNQYGAKPKALPQS